MGKKGIALNTVIKILILVVVLGFILLVLRGDVFPMPEEAKKVGSAAVCELIYQKPYEDALPEIARKCSPCDETHLNSMDENNKNCCRYYCSKKPEVR